MTPDASPLPSGKVSPRLVESLLRGRRPAAGEVVGPGPGRDGAVLRIPRGGGGVGEGEGREAIAPEEGTFLVAASDPITFTAEEIGWYTVHVNANDVACMGADPTWFLATLLLPNGTSSGEVETIFDQIREACEAVGAGLVGGHTEVTPGIDRPLVAGTMLGVTDRWISAGGAEPGDVLLLTKGIAVEGTAILAAEAEGRLRGEVSDAMLVRARRLLREPGISVVSEARIARSAGTIHALHDPTEGGLATGIHELCAASGTGAVVELDRVPVLDETREVAGVLGLDPLSLLASGALVIAAAETDARPVVEALRSEGIEVARIGSLNEAEEGIVAVDAAGRAEPLGLPETDELTKVLRAGDPRA